VSRYGTAGSIEQQQQQQQQQQQIVQLGSKQQQQQAADSPDECWQLLLASRESKQLLQALPCLRMQQQQQQQQAPATAAQQHDVSAAADSLQQQQQHRQELASVLLALHSVYEDCKLCKLRQHLLQLLAPLLWSLAGWLGAAAYQEHYERDASPTGLRNAALQLVDAAADLAGTSAAAAAELLQCGGSSSSSSGSNTAASLQELQLQCPPGNMLRCLSMLIAGSAGYPAGKIQQQQQDFVPYLASRGSSCVYRSCQLLEAYQLLSSCARSCAAAVATAVSSSYQQQQQQGASVLASLVGSFGLLSGTSSSSSSKGESVTGVSDDALAAELEHLLLLGSQQMVLLLVRQGWDVLAMDGLPLGVALPLREAVARCRTNPPAGERFDQNSSVISAICVVEWKLGQQEDYVLVLL
jgi:hypothetical protein